MTEKWAKFTLFVVPVAVMAAPVLIVVLVQDYFSLLLEEPAGLWSGIGVAYLVMVILGSGGHTSIETIVIAMFVTLPAIWIWSAEQPHTQWDYYIACAVVAAWYNWIIWWMRGILDRLGKPLEQKSDAREIPPD